MEKEQNNTEKVETSNALTTVNTSELNKESLTIINQIIAETDIEKTKDLTYLFNINQNKKTMVRVNKLNELLDSITDEAIRRFSERPDEISNQELMTSMKTVNDMIERGQKQVVGSTETPLIQINQQNNELNVGQGSSQDSSKLNRDSREKVKTAVLSILNGLVASQQSDTDQNVTEEPEIIDAEVNDEHDN